MAKDRTIAPLQIITQEIYNISKPTEKTKWHPFKSWKIQYFIADVTDNSLVSFTQLATGS